jgi:magnesium-transporting ATPase (P-type)
LKFLGSVDVIATDKTGTLTQNEMTVTDIFTPTAQYAVTGTGYAPAGDFTLDQEVITPADHQDLEAALLTAGYEANDTTLAEIDGKYEINGEPTDGAFITAYQKAFGETEESDELDLMPFDSDYRYMAKLVR